MSFHQLLKSKIKDRGEAQGILSSLQKAGKKIVFTNGCFDILHPGHVDYLSQARDLGDFMVLGLNTDNSVKRLNKAPNRPVNPEEARAVVLAGLAYAAAWLFAPLDIAAFASMAAVIAAIAYVFGYRRWRRSKAG